jgi:cyclopropane fatty-acyl-phospholipid synthase-like methyltransferase
LDIGCGWLRGGVYFIDYLDTGHYYGFDKDQIQLDRGEILLKGKDLIHKKPKIELIYSSREIGNFIGKRMVKEGFDYMMAYSVFTHIDPYMVDRLFARIFPFLKNTGKFFATFYKHKHDSVKIGTRHPQRGEEYRSVKYPFSFFEDLARKNGMFVEHLSLPKDVHSQYWMCFSKEPMDGITSL